MEKIITYEGHPGLTQYRNWGDVKKGIGDKKGRVRWLFWQLGTSEEDFGYNGASFEVMCTNIYKIVQDENASPAGLRIKDGKLVGGASFRLRLKKQLRKKNNDAIEFIRNLILAQNILLKRRASQNEPLKEMEPPR